MGYMEKANYFTEAQTVQGWCYGVILDFAKQNPHLMTPELGEEIKISLPPKQALENPIKSIDSDELELKNILDPIIMTKQENYEKGRGMQK